MGNMTDTQKILLAYHTIRAKCVHLPAILAEDRIMMIAMQNSALAQAILDHLSPATEKIERCSIAAQRAYADIALTVITRAYAVAQSPRDQLYSVQLNAFQGFVLSLPADMDPFIQKLMTYYAGMWALLDFHTADMLIVPRGDDVNRSLASVASKIEHPQDVNMPYDWLLERLGGEAYKRVHRGSVIKWYSRQAMLAEIENMQATAITG